MPAIQAAGAVVRPAARGTVVEVGETVIAASNGNAQMRMVDNAFLAVRPDTELEITDYLMPTTFTSDQSLQAKATVWDDAES